MSHVHASILTQMNQNQSHCVNWYDLFEKRSESIL